MSFLVSHPLRSTSSHAVPKSPVRFELHPIIGGEINAHEAMTVMSGHWGHDAPFVTETRRDASEHNLNRRLPTGADNPSRGTADGFGRILDFPSCPNARPAGVRVTCLSNSVS